MATLKASPFLAKHPRSRATTRWNVIHHPFGSSELPDCPSQAPHQKTLLQKNHNRVVIEPDQTEDTDDEQPTDTPAAAFSTIRARRDEVPHAAPRLEGAARSLEPKSLPEEGKEYTEDAITGVTDPALPPEGGYWIRSHSACCGCRSSAFR